MTTMKTTFTQLEDFLPLVELIAHLSGMNGDTIDNEIMRDNKANDNPNAKIYAYTLNRFKNEKIYEEKHKHH